MKTLGFCGLVLLLTFAARSQEVSPPPAPPVLTATNKLQRIFGPTAVYDGVLPDVKRRGGIMVAPDLRAPVVPGHEFDNVSINPNTGRAQGVILFAIRF